MSARRGGFVLIAALWLLVALAAVGLDASMRSRTRRLAAANRIDEVRARAAALAGTEYARSRLTAAMLDRADEIRSDALERARNDRQRRSLQQRSVRNLFRAADPLEDPWRAPDELVVPDMAFGDARYTLRVRDTGAALNLNEIDDGVIRQFFALGMGLDYAEADELAQAIMDWRDDDDIPRLNGAEREQYLDAGAPVLPPDRDFAEIDELRHLLGMTPELYEAALPYLTLIGSGNVNVNAAPAPVLLALPGVQEATVRELLRLREQGVFPRSLNQLQDLLPASLAEALEAQDDEFNRLTTFSTNEVEILSDGRVDGSPLHVRARVVVARSNTGAVVVWRKIE
jgi:type II secretory pathway component PulK